jgi:hypothetical protein
MTHYQEGRVLNEYRGVMKHTSTRSELKQALREYERETKWRRSVEALLLLFVVVPAAAFGFVLLIGWLN